MLVQKPFEMAELEIVGIYRIAEKRGSTILIEIKFHNRWNHGLICLVRFEIKKAPVNHSKRLFFRHTHRDCKHQELRVSGILSKSPLEFEVKVHVKRWNNVTG